MLKYTEIPTYSEIIDEPLEPEEYEFDKIILELEAQGHKVIMLGRAAAIVEQCQDDDDFPKGWSNRPLKITIYAGIDGHKSSLYIHGGRYGLMEIIEQFDERVKKYVPIDYEQARAVTSLQTAESAQAVYQLMNVYLQTVFRREANGIFQQEPDALLEEYAENAKDNMRKYLERVSELERA